MSTYKAVALDFDGTLTDSAGVSGAVIDALRRARSRGVLLLLVTGRILDELEQVFPACHGLFDAIVAENGAVLSSAGHARLLVSPVSSALYDRLCARGVDARRGRVLIACHAADNRAVLDETRALGLEDQLVRNRGELMILPPGVTKASGVQAAMRELGLNAHNLVAVGDAENDHAMLAAAELGVAVRNAVPSLKAEADLVLSEPNGAGIVSLLDGSVLRGDELQEVPRHQISIGTDSRGHPVRLGSRRRTLVTGGTHSGKSFVAGLVTERLVAAGYVVLVFDAEGDHVELDRLPPVVTTKVEPLASDGATAILLGHRSMSQIVDMSELSGPRQQDLVASLLPHIEAQRRHRGTPHMIVFDEAHLFFTDPALPDVLSSDDGGCCLITYVPAALPQQVLEQMDRAVVLPFGTTTAPDPNVTTVATIGAVDPLALARRLDRTTGAVLLDRDRPGEIIDIVIDDRSTPHVRHRHKYVERVVDPQHSFRFCERDGDTSGVVARSIDELRRELHRCSRATLRHHCSRHDLSRWTADIVHDEALAEALSAGERLAMKDDSHIERGRAALLDAIESRYLR